MRTLKEKLLWLWEFTSLQAARDAISNLCYSPLAEIKG